MFKTVNKVLGKVTRILIVVSIAVVVTAYYRPIQEQIHKGIKYIYDHNNTIGEALYDLNGFLLNGKQFDLERSQKFAIYENYSKIVLINLRNDDAPVDSASGLGTGWFVDVTDTEGYIITNYHVISRAVENKNIKLESLIILIGKVDVKKKKKYKYKFIFIYIIKKKIKKKNILV